MLLGGVSAFVSAALLAQETPPADQPVIRAPGSSNDEVRVSHILLASQEEAVAVQKEVAANGGDRKAFSAAARKHSKDVTTKVLGGNLDWFSQGSGMAQPFTEAAYGTKVGAAAGPIKTQFGYHLILVTDRRDRTSKAPTDAPPPGTQPAPAPPPAQPGHEDHGHEGHAHEQPVSKAAGPNDLAPVPVVEPAKPAPVDGKRRNLAEQAFRLSIESARAGSGQQQHTLTPETAAEYNLVLKNESSKEQKFFVRELLPLGFKLVAVGELQPLNGDFTSIAEPASYFTSMKTYEIQGIEVSLNDYFKGLTARRYGVNWDWSTFLANLETRFPKVKESPDYAAFSDRTKRFPLTVDMVYRDVSPRLMFQRGKDMPLTFAATLLPDKKYVAQIRFAGNDPPVTIALDSKNQFQGVRHFAALAQDGFYDGLDFFEVEEGDYLLGGCPTRTGTGAPSSNLPLIRNESKVTHKRGTVSLVSRSVRSKGPVRGGQVGSIFVVCLKPHPEWDEDHVPIGEVTSGLETLEKAGRRPAFRDITILPEDQVAPQVTSTTPTPPPVVGNPEAIIKTAKGTITVELFEDVARNTVANFVTLADKDKFYNKGAKEGEKQKLFGLMKDQAGKPLLIQGGSPTSDGEGGPGYAVANELNTKRCVKGALVMAVQYDEGTQKYVPDTAGSQFFLCLQDIPYYDYLKAFTVFGQVKEGLDVLDKLAEGDAIESIEITKKKTHPYAFRKVTAP